MCVWCKLYRVYACLCACSCSVFDAYLTNCVLVCLFEYRCESGFGPVERRYAVKINNKHKHAPGRLSFTLHSLPPKQRLFVSNVRDQTNGVALPSCRLHLIGLLYLSNNGHTLPTLAFDLQRYQSYTVSSYLRASTSILPSHNKQAPQALVWTIWLHDRMALPLVSWINWCLFKHRIRVK